MKKSCVSRVKGYEGSEIVSKLVRHISWMLTENIIFQSWRQNGVIFVCLFWFHRKNNSQNITSINISVFTHQGHEPDSQTISTCLMDVLQEGSLMLRYPESFIMFPIFLDLWLGEAYYLSCSKVEMNLLFEEKALDFRGWLLFKHPWKYSLKQKRAHALAHRTCGILATEKWLQRQT